MRIGSTVGIALSFSLTALLTFVAGVYATEESTNIPPQSAPMQLSGDKELIARVRALSALQQRVVEGDKSALVEQVTVARAIAQEIEKRPISAWDDPRNLRALIKYVLSGGAPASLEKAFKSANIPEEYTALVTGVIAYARGDKAKSFARLGSVNHRLLASSLAGHVALVKAVLASQTSNEDALELCDEATLLSPGTHIEEAALRLAVSIAIATGDATSVGRAHSRHLIRFPNSLYARDIDGRVASVIAVNAEAAAAEFRTMDELPQLVPPSRRRAFFAALAEAGLRAGKPDMAIRAARVALLPPESSPASSAETTASLLAIEGSALILTGDKDTGMRRLDEARGAQPTAEVANLITTAKNLVALIDAPPAPSGAPPPVAKAMTVAPASPSQPLPPASQQTKSSQPHFAAVLARGAETLAGVDALIQQAAK